ncbi:N-6 DNA methylase [Micromonospora sp. NIE79]|uniref:site-specific DNA-methyltransferase (adenine-specific) n=1 Tax=Micromonospora trifolii TaxID=2911208 RepID=A0ABS9NA54_9ACTN|nr:N-6 DNA methylase [Micromonospora trifolii]MCG5446114.1 N-6 DNA methylase [Micromonospora trifolii]
MLDGQADCRPPLVLIAPSYGNPATRKRFHDTLEEPVDFLAEEFAGVLSEDETHTLLALHPENSARFWGALASHSAIIDRLQQGDVVVFTGHNRVQAIGTLGCRLRNEALADSLWPPKPGDRGWLNVYTVVNFHQVSELEYKQLRAWVGSSDQDVFQSARVLTPEKSAAVITGLVALADTGEGPGDDRPLATPREFASHLFMAWDQLRGNADRSQVGWYLLGVFLLKYASDSVDGGRRAPLQGWLPDGPLTNLPTFDVPDVARWRRLVRLRSGIGRELDRALQALEHANPRALDGVSRQISFERSGDQPGLPDHDLSLLLQHFDRYRLRPNALESGEGLRAGIDQVVEMATGSTIENGSQFSTPDLIRRLMVQLLDPAGGMSVYDPAAGTGGLLIRAAEHMVARGASPHRMMVAGQEHSAQAWLLSKMNLLLQGVPTDSLALGDTLTDPQHVRSGALERFDRVLSDPPFGQHRSAEAMPYPERFRWSSGRPGTQRAELLFVQHMLSVLKADGVAAVVLPRNVLFGRGDEQAFRTRLLDDDAVEAVVGLPAQLSGVAACVLILRAPNSKPNDRAGKVLFTDVTPPTDGHVGSSDLDTQLHQLVQDYLSFESRPSFARVVGRDELRDNGDDLTIDRYVSTESFDTDAVGEKIEGWESTLRGLVHDGAYDEAAVLLRQIGEDDPQGLARLGTEFGFLDIVDTDRDVIAAIWRPTASRNPFPSPATGSNPEIATEPAARGDSPDPPVRSDGTPPVRSPQESGAVLEQATVDLLTRLFLIQPDDQEVLVTRLRSQRPGPQYGHDIELDCTVAGSPTVRCHVECKNLSRPIRLNDIADKLLQEKYSTRSEKLDHWILISPHSGPTNEVRKMLDAWEQHQEYPFSVQIWSPEDGIQGLFALDPEVYRAVYDTPPGQPQLAMAQRAMEQLQSRLAPRLRLDRVWHRYLSDPQMLCFVNEDARHFNELYTNQVQLRATDRNGSLLAHNLLDETVAWLDNPDSTEPLLLLADFGEGKSFFTYSLARQLCQDYLREPETGVVPLRIPLREFARAGDSRRLFQRRLAELGATVADWRELERRGRTLVILDGFDEMSTDLSPAAITRSLNDIRSCLDELGKSKVLVTSRHRVLDGGRDWDRVLDRLREPRVLRIAPGTRAERVRYLEQFATDDRSTQALEDLRNLYDPIGLAAKPLFLQMIKETLSELPADTFSELTLYDTYVRRSLHRKIELFDDEA